METEYSSEMSVHFYWIKWHHISENSILHSQDKSHNGNGRDVLL
jgi:hypothetical protein